MELGFETVSGRANAVANLVEAKQSAVDFSNGRLQIAAKVFVCASGRGRRWHCAIAQAMASGQLMALR
jgi:hypothetical protein